MKEFGDYYLGLDCGTDSVGWAVTDTEYNVLKFNGKDMWGIRLFEQATPAKDRRIARCARRRRARQVQRIDWLQELFAEEVSKIDPEFFLRLNESRYLASDRTIFQSNTLFNDENYKDKDYHKEFPTVFHLRKALIHGVHEDGTPVNYDPRFVYLALHHILKNRGHFLLPGEGRKAINSVIPLFERLNSVLGDLFEVELRYPEREELESALTAKRKSERVEKLTGKVYVDEPGFSKVLVKAISGYKIKLSDLFDDESLDESDIASITFDDSSFEEKVDTLMVTVGEDRCQLIEVLKAIYDWSMLADIMGGFAFISEAKVQKYNENKRDLKVLKKLVKTYGTDAQYKAFFHDTDKPGFSRHIGADHSNKYKNNKKPTRRCSKEDFYKELKKLLESLSPEAKTDAVWQSVYDRVSNQDYLNLLISSDNSVLPHQVHGAELDAILEAAEEHLSFLSDKDSEGLSVSERIRKIFLFRIPYYVGPLTDFHDDKVNANKFSWLIRKEDGRILPWNFDRKINIEESAEKFILRMTNKCTYLRDKDVIPKKSLLYSKFMVLNELNNLRVNGEKITVPQKQTIYEGLFKTTKRVTQKRLKDFMVCQGWYEKGSSLEVSGIDGDFKSSLESYIDFKDYLESGALTRSDVEDIIRCITLFGDDRVMLSARLNAQFREKLSKDQVRTIVNKFHYKDWGRFSKEFLTEVYSADRHTGEAKSIITMLWETNDNLMMLLSSDYDFIEDDRLNPSEAIEQLDYSLVDYLYVSPAVKRQIWQMLKIVKEIRKITGHDPKKVFFEFAREEREKKRTKTRKQSLLELYQQIKTPDQHTRELLESLRSEDDRRLQGDKLYLYYTQLGRCMYSKEPIDLEDFGKYDIDHIYPQSKIKDDSLTNRVLVRKDLNGRKKDVYPLSDDIRKSMQGFWFQLKDMGLINKEKYERLTRHSQFTADELASFVNRQLVETQQSTKEGAGILKRFFPASKVVYSKAGNVSSFRQKFGFIKSRIVNDLHHAKDAYLNIVVGNVWDTKFSREFFDRLRFNIPSYNIQTEKLFSQLIPGAWDPRNAGTLSTVSKVMSKNTILFTRQQLEKHGQLFSLQPISEGKGLLPLKPSDRKLQKLVLEKGKQAAYEEWTNKYGGYDNLSVEYFILVKYKKGKNTIASFEPMRSIYAAKMKTSEDIVNYCREELGIENAEVILPKVRINTLIKLNGFPMHISNKSGESIGVKPAVQLVLDKANEQYSKKLFNFMEKRKKYKKPDLEVSENDKLSRDDNLRLFEALCLKVTNTIFAKRPSSQSKLLLESRQAFLGLTIEEQISVLSECLTYCSCNYVSCDLSLIGGTRRAGMPVISKNCNLSKNELVIVNQSATGLFETMKTVK